MTFIIVAIVAIAVFFLVFNMFFKKGVINKHQGAYAEAEALYKGNEEKYKEEYLSDPKKFKLINDVIPSDEVISGFSNCSEYKTAGEEIKRQVIKAAANVEIYNANIPFLVATDKNLHYIEFNGEKSVDHMIFDYSEMKFLKVEEGKITDQLTGGGSKKLKLTFDYKDGKKYAFHGAQGLAVYPTKKNIYDMSAMKASAENQMRYMIIQNFFDGFEAEIAKHGEVEMTQTDLL